MVRHPPKNRFLSTPSARRATVSHNDPAYLLQISIHALREEGDQHHRSNNQRFKNFYPRPPRGGRPSKMGSLWSVSRISIHALREVGDQQRFFCPQAHGNFYPRPPRGGRPHNNYRAGATEQHFYPRPPRGGRHASASLSVLQWRISIHALREEGDTRPRPVALSPGHFYPRPPRGGRRLPRHVPHGGFRFLSTPSARRATKHLCGVRLRHPISIHALREEGDAVCGKVCRDVNDFYPRPPRGGRRSPSPALCTPSLFLSTPSARRATRQPALPMEEYEISIHALREEGDHHRRRLCGSPADISIHALREEGDSWPSARLT